MTINKSELARELGCDRATIRRYAERGMPLGSRSDALAWICQHTSGYRGGWGAQRGKPDVQQRASTLLSADPAREPDDPRARYEALRLRFAELPRLVLEVDPDAPAWLVIAVAVLADDAAGALADLVDRSGEAYGFPVLITDEQRTLPDVDRRVFVRKLTAKQWAAAQEKVDAFVDAVSRRLYDESRKGD